MSQFCKTRLPGDISSYAPGNSLIITDMGRNIRILKFVNELDIPTGREKSGCVDSIRKCHRHANPITNLFGMVRGRLWHVKSAASTCKGRGSASATAGAPAGSDSSADSASTVSKVIAKNALTS